MDIEMTRDGATLHVVLSGSVDTVTAPELEKKLQPHWQEITGLILDFADVDYVSSAGLRVLLIANKQLGGRGKLLLRNVNEEIKEVFEMTGFDKFFHLE